MGVGGGLGSWLFCLGREGARGGWGGHSGNSDNEGGRAACKHPRRVGGLLLVPGGHGSGWVAVRRAGRGGRASRLGWLGWLEWWSCWSLGGRPRRAASSRLRAKLAYLSVMGGLGGLLVQLGALWWSFQRWYGPCVDGYGGGGAGGERAVEVRRGGRNVRRTSMLREKTQRKGPPGITWGVPFRWYA